MCKDCVELIKVRAGYCSAGFLKRVRTYSQCRLCLFFLAFYLVPIHIRGGMGPESFGGRLAFV